jgi:hypothetical protein
MQALNKLLGRSRRGSTDLKIEALDPLNLLAKQPSLPTLKSPPLHILENPWDISANELPKAEASTVQAIPASGENLKENMDKSEEFTSSKKAAQSPPDLNQLTMLEAFGVNITSILSYDASNASSDSVSSRDPRDRSSSSNKPKSATKTVQDNDSFAIFMSQEGITSPIPHRPSSSSAAARGEIKGILKNAYEDSAYSAPSTTFFRSRRASLQVDDRSKRNSGAIEYSAKNRPTSQQESSESRQSIFAAFQGDSAETDLGSIEIGLCDAETPKFEVTLKKVMKTKSFKAGDFILRKHDMGNEMFLLATGSVEILSAVSCLIINHLGRKDMFQYSTSRIFLWGDGCSFQHPAYCFGQGIGRLDMQGSHSGKIPRLNFRLSITRKEVCRSNLTYRCRFKIVASRRMREVKKARESRRHVRISVNN